MPHGSVLSERPSLMAALKNPAFGSKHIYTSRECARQGNIEEINVVCGRLRKKLYEIGKYEEALKDVKTFIGHEDLILLRRDLFLIMENLLNVHASFENFTVKQHYRAIGKLDPNLEEATLKYQEEDKSTLELIHESKESFHKMEELDIEEQRRGGKVILYTVEEPIDNVTDKEVKDILDTGDEAIDKETVIEIKSSLDTAGVEAIEEVTEKESTKDIKDVVDAVEEYNKLLRRLKAYYKSKESDSDGLDRKFRLVNDDMPNLYNPFKKFKPSGQHQHQQEEEEEVEKEEEEEKKEIPNPPAIEFEIETSPWIQDRIAKKDETKKVLPPIVKDAPISESIDKGKEKETEKETEKEEEKENSEPTEKQGTKPKEKLRIQKKNRQSTFKDYDFLTREVDKIMPKESPSKKQVRKGSPKKPPTKTTKPPSFDPLGVRDMNIPEVRSEKGLKEIPKLVETKGSSRIVKTKIPDEEIARRLLDEKINMPIIEASKFNQMDSLKTLSIQNRASYFRDYVPLSKEIGKVLNDITFYHNKQKERTMFEV